MTKNSDSAEAPASAISQIVISQGDDRFDQTSIAVHWLTVVLIVTQFVSAWWREAVGHESALAPTLLSVHLTSGMLIWIVSVIRLAWRRYFAYLPPFPPSMPKLQQTIAKANEYGLYVLLLTQPITGLARVLLRGQSFDLLFWRVPALMEPNPAARIIFVQAHEIGAKALIALIGFHAGAALFHRLVLRDGVLQRMLPLTSPRARLTPALVKNEAE